MPSRTRSCGKPFRSKHQRAPNGAAMKLAPCLVATLLMTSNAFAADLPQPPDVARKPHVVKAPHGAERNDEYYWLRDDTRKNPEMLAYLDAENAYTNAFMARLK